MSLAMVTATLAVATLAARQDLTQRDADSMAHKIDAIVAQSNLAPEKAKPKTTTVTEREVNAYFRFTGKSVLPVGVYDPQITIVDGSHLEATAMVDLDAVRTSKKRGLLDPMNYLGGRVQIRAAGTFQGASGMGTLRMTSSSIGGIPISVSVLQEVVNFYARTPENPEGFDLEKPFELPSRIRNVILARGTATFVQ